MKDKMCMLGCTAIKHGIIAVLLVALFTALKCFYNKKEML